MRRLLPLILLFGLACDEKPATPVQQGTGVKAPPKPPVLPTTGSPMLKNLRDSLVEDVQRMEQELKEGKMPERRFVDAAKKGVENLIVAAQMSVDREASEMARKELSLLRDQQAALDKKRSDLSEGIHEIEGLLHEDKPPEGFTVDELKDRLGQRQEEMRALAKEDQDLRSRMQEKEDLLSKGQVPPQGTTVHTDELDAAKELEKRILALEARLK